MPRKISLAVTIITLLAAAPLLSACYTTEGAGQDIKAAGHGVSHAGQDLSNSAAEHAPYRP